jgi:predicted DNA-binding protein
MSRPSKYTDTMHVKVTVRIPDPMRAALTALAQRQGKNLSEVSREAFEQHLEKLGVAVTN